MDLTFLTDNPRPPKKSDMFVGPVFCAAGLYAESLRPEHVPGEPVEALVFVGHLLLGVGLSLLAGALLSKKNKNQVQDDKPTTLATRGSFLPRVDGRRRLGAVFGWAGDRHTRKEKQGGGKGSLLGGGKKVIVFQEAGWHQIAVGPLFAMTEIEQGGEPIFTGRITSDSHPSGSLIDLGHEGSFRIFWGENDQPVNTFLGDASRVGVTSRWPHCAYIEWQRKRLGTSPNWPNMTYVVEARPSTLITPILSDTDSYDGADELANGSPLEITEVLNGVQGVGYYKVQFHKTLEFPIGERFDVIDNVGLGGTVEYTVALVEEGHFGRGSSLFDFTKVYPVGGVVGASTAPPSSLGDVQPYTNQKNDGWNGAHLIARYLFEGWPHGIALDQSRWDMQSLEDLGTLVGPAGEALKCSVIVQNGTDLRGILGGMLQDLGCMISIDMRTGLLRFVPLRTPSGTLPFISNDALTALTEIEMNLGSRPVDRIVFSFSDEDNSFRDMTISVDDDGQAARQEYYRSRDVQIVMTTHFPSAAAITQRRQYEELSGGGEFTISANRASRSLLPGEPILSEEFDDVLRLLGTKHDPLSGQVKLLVSNDFYGGQVSQFEIPQGDTGGEGLPVAPDLLYDFIEIPEQLLPSAAMAIMFLYVRQHSTVSGHNLHVSRDDITYLFLDSDLSIMSGGALDVALSEDMEQEIGPEFTLFGPDAGDILDLTSDLVSWRGGRQLVVFVGNSGVAEVCFLKKVTFIGGNTYRLDGLIRKRYDTWSSNIVPLVDHKFFILQDSDGAPIQDVLLEPQVTLFGKAEPLGQGTIPLSSVTSRDVPLYGKGVRPIPVGEAVLDTDANVVGPGNTRWNGTFYATTGSAPNDDLDITWGYSTPRAPASGAGLFGAGDTIIDPLAEGTFYVEILDSGDVVQRATTVILGAYTYTRADRIADFTSEPALFKIRVTQQRDGQEATPITTTFTHTN